MVGAAQVEGVAAVNVVVQSLLNQVLRFVPCQLRHSAESNPRDERGLRDCPHPEQPPQSRAHPQFSGPPQSPHPQNGSRRSSRRLSWAALPLGGTLGLTTHLESRKMSFMSRLARNMNMLLCSLISVTALGGSEWPTATRPTFW